MSRSSDASQHPPKYCDIQKQALPLSLTQPGHHHHSQYTYSYTAHCPRSTANSDTTTTTATLTTTTGDHYTITTSKTYLKSCEEAVQG
jgi:hypothetical protein